MKPNSYVYPYVPFKDLSNKQIRKDFISGEKEVSFNEIKSLISQMKPKVVSPSGKTLEEKILSVFLDKNFLFGPKKYIEANKSFWQEKLHYFIQDSKKIQFTLLGFPFKMPLLLKTNRSLPDMGEVLSLKQLMDIAEDIKNIYSPGVVINVFTEGGFGKFVGVSKKKVEDYKKFLILIARRMGFNQYIKIKDLTEMEKYKSFKMVFRDNLKKMEKSFRLEDKDFMKKYNGAKDSIFRIVNPREKDELVLMEVYDESLSDSEISERARMVRKRISDSLPKAIIRYFAYLKTRDDLNFLEKRVPHFIPLSVSPKPNRLGILPIDKSINKLPYHSVPVYWTKKRRFSMEYLIDIKRSDINYTAVYLNGDWENLPFYYER